MALRFSRPHDSTRLVYASRRMLDSDHYELKAMYGELDMLVGTSFHSVSFALNGGHPVHRHRV